MSEEEEKTTPYRHPDCQCCKDAVSYMSRRGREVGEALLGSQGDTYEHLGETDEHLEDEQEFHDAVAEVAARCDCCGLWSEPNAVVPDKDCDNCRDDEPGEPS